MCVILRPQCKLALELRALQHLARTHQPGITYPRTQPTPWLISPKCKTIVRRITIWDCIAKLWGVIQDYIRIDYNLALSLQMLPGSGRPCKSPPVQDYLSKDMTESLTYPTKT